MSIAIPGRARTAPVVILYRYLYEERGGQNDGEKTLSPWTTKSFHKFRNHNMFLIHTQQKTMEIEDAENKRNRTAKPKASAKGLRDYATQLEEYNRFFKERGFEA